MVEQKKSKKKRSKRERKERRFGGEDARTSPYAVGVGMVGALALGAGVYAQWVSAQAPTYAPFVLAGGAFALGGAMVFGDLRAQPVRVGDAGVATEKGSEVVRILWCDVDRVSVEGTRLTVKAKSSSLSLSLRAQPRACAWILAEATRRVPDVMDVKRDAVSGLPEPKESDGEMVTVEGFQVAGRLCAKSGKTIAFERDARLCPQCGQVYFHENVPKRCSTCQAELGDKALEV